MPKHSKIIIYYIILYIYIYIILLQFQIINLCMTRDGKNTYVRGYLRIKYATNS